MYIALSNITHYSEVTRASRFKSPETGLFAQNIVQANKKLASKHRFTVSLWRESTIDKGLKLPKAFPWHDVIMVG